MNVDALGNALFVQIAISKSRDVKEPDIVYALDLDGVVWWFDDDDFVWRKMPSARSED